MLEKTRKNQGGQLYQGTECNFLQINDHFPGGPVLDFIGANDAGSGGDNWSYKMCKAPVKSSPPRNQHPDFYRPDALPVAHPTVSQHCTE